MRTRPGLRRGLAVLLFLAVILGLGVAPVLRPARAVAAEPGSSVEPGSPLALFLETYSLIMSSSVRSPDPELLITSAIEGMLRGLNDAYAEYYTPKALDYFQSELQNSYGGIGVVLRFNGAGTPVVERTLPGSPAERAGLLPGDSIVAIDGQSVVGQGPDATNAIRGEPGTKVTLTVRRPGRIDEFDLEITRELIANPTVEWRATDNGVTGYIKVTAFYENTAQEFDGALQDLAGKGVRALILDLRDNPGGLLDASVTMAERFLPKGHVVIRLHWAQETEVVRSRQDPDYELLEGIPYKPDGTFPWPVVVLVNGGTASAAEILATSLRENGVALIFGEQSYGKGSVQSLFTLANGGGVKITSADWTTATGKSINGVGITPDEVVVQPPAQGSGPGSGFGAQGGGKSGGGQPGSGSGTYLPGQGGRQSEPKFEPVTDRWFFNLGMIGTDVLVLQTRLAQLGYDPGELDGFFCVDTQAALKAFQKNVGLPETGATDEATVKALNSAKIADHPAGAGSGGAGGGGGPGGGTGSGGQTVDQGDDLSPGDLVMQRAREWLLERLGLGKK